MGKASFQVASAGVLAAAVSSMPPRCEPIARMPRHGSAWRGSTSARTKTIRRLAVALGFCLAAQALALAPSEARIVARKLQPDIAAAAAAAAAPLPPAHLELALNLPLTKIQTVANLFAFQMEKAGTISGQNFEGTLSLSNITLKPSDDSEHPLALGARFKFTGHINGRNVVGGGTSSLNLALKVGADWCPIVDLTAPSTQWDNDIDAPLPVTLAIRFGVVDNIIASELKAATTCAVLKGYLQELWQPAAVRLFGGPGGARTTDTSVFLNLRPQAIEVTSVEVKGGRIVAKLAILGAAAVAGKQGNSSKLALPDPSTFTHSPAEAGKSDLNLQLFGDVGVGP
jgi:hypothetical protein